MFLFTGPARLVLLFFCHLMANKYLQATFNIHTILLILRYNRYDIDDTHMFFSFVFSITVNV